MYTLNFSPDQEEISLNNTPNELTIKRKWFDYGRILQLSIAVLLNIGIGFIVYKLVSYETVSNMLIIGIISVSIIALAVQAAALWILYQGICGLFNTTVIKVDHSSISIDYKPLPWFGAKKIQRDDIVQLNITEKDYSDADIKHVLYQIQVVVKNSEPVFLLKNLETPEIAKFIEEKIEQFLFRRDKIQQEVPVL